jgi:hypothetical protein
MAQLPALPPPPPRAPRVYIDTDEEGPGRATHTRAHAAQSEARGRLHSCSSDGVEGEESQVTKPAVADRGNSSFPVASRAWNGHMSDGAEGGTTRSHNICMHALWILAGSRLVRRSVARRSRGCGGVVDDNISRLLPVGDVLDDHRCALLLFASFVCMCAFAARA